VRCRYGFVYNYGFRHCQSPHKSVDLLLGSTTPWWHYVLAILIAAGYLVVMWVVVKSFFTTIEQYERGVVFRFGKVIGGPREPGIMFKVPAIDRVVKVNMQVTPLALEAQQVITKDSVSLSILAVVFYRVTDAIMSEVEVAGYEEAIEEFGQSVMRKLIGRHYLEQILHSDDEIVEQIQKDLEHVASKWGIEITRIELKDIDLPKSMRRAMAASTEAQREAEAKVVGAKGELDSAAMLRDAANMLTPVALELRRLQVTREIADERSTIIVVPSGSTGMVAAESAAGSIAGSQQQ
jgi:regulator of protease activity HflC (stomatin/prohibitin superfamily)